MKWPFPAPLWAFISPLSNFSLGAHCAKKNFSLPPREDFSLGLHDWVQEANRTSVRHLGAENCNNCPCIGGSCWTLLTRVYRDKKQHLPLPLGSTEIEGTRGAIPLTRLSENKLRSRLWPRRGYWGGAQGIRRVLEGERPVRMPLEMVLTGCAGDGVRSWSVAFSSKACLALRSQPCPGE